MAFDPFGVSAWTRMFDLGIGWLSGVARMQQAGLVAARRQGELMANAYARLWGESPDPVLPADARFGDEAWQQNVNFDVLKQAYLITAQWMLDLADALEDVDPQLHQRAKFWTRQLVDALSPTNFPATNPAVLQEIVRTGGQNLVRGMRNFVADLEKGQISMVPDQAFEVGKDLAITPGQVVLRNPLIELIQYAPTTAQVHAVPLLVIPPWVNKYYVMDMRPENSMFKYLVDAGFTVFALSWKNPGAGDPVLDMDWADYMEQGPLAALRAVKAITGTERVNMAGYCLGGIMLQVTLAYLAARGDETPNTATFFATHQDFSDAGDIAVFISDPEVRFLEWLMEASGGYLDGRNMAATFNALRANDLFWPYVVNNYLLGKEPPAFDLLYWNSDGTRVPARVHSYLLREMFLGDKLGRPGGLSVRGVPIDVRRITVPAYTVAGSTDHIVPWHGAFRMRERHGGPVRFVLAESGHIAGIINPPAKNKRCYWVYEDHGGGPNDPEEWLAGATRHEGSWWVDWVPWLAARSGDSVQPPRMGSEEYPALAAAPGTYVGER